MVLPWSSPVKDVFCLSPSFPSIWKRKKRLHMPKCRSPHQRIRRSTPTCRQPHRPEKSPASLCGGREPVPAPRAAPAGHARRVGLAFLSGRSWPDSGAAVLVGSDISLEQPRRV